MKCFLVLAIALFLAGCNGERTLLQKFVPKDDDAFARHFLELVKSSDDPAATAMLEEKLRPQAAEEFSKMRPALARGEAQSFETINFLAGYTKLNNEPTKKQSELTYQIHFPDGWAVADVIVESVNGNRHISGAHVVPLTNSLAVLNAFSLQHKSAGHYVVLCVAILVPLLVLLALIVCVRSRVRRRWLWIIFILIGIGQFQLDWTTGVWNFQTISFLLFGAGFMRNGLYGPWILKVSLPLGALLFLLLRRWLQRPANPATLADSAPGKIEPPRNDS
ncbi:MAG: hypothetical protein ACR2HH_17085 [Chthoniobacterales bacterium]